MQRVLVSCLLASYGSFALATASAAAAPAVDEMCSDGSCQATPADVDDTGLLAYSIQKQLRRTGSGGGNCPEMQAVLDEYGSEIGSDGELFGLGAPDTFYTWQGFVDAVNLYNKWATAQSMTPFLGDPDVSIDGATVVALMANLEVETLHWTACKERVRMADGSCPCDSTPGCTGGCSGGQIDSYTPEKAAAAGFTVLDCNGVKAPAKGCVDFWGNTVQDATWCWWGRGATQLTWAGNYGAQQKIVQEAGGLDICNDPDGICNSDTIAWLVAISYWQANSAPWDEAHTFESSLEVIRPADTSANPQRKANYDKWMAALGIAPPPEPTSPPSEGTTTVKAGEGCWQIADRVCPGKGNEYATVICDPPACSPGPALGATVTYKCAGC